MHHLVKLIRPKQWLKNVLVFTAPVAAGSGSDLKTMLLALAAFACFSMVASGLYAINDVRDAARDRLHPRKKSRPIASGAISPIQGTVVGGVFLAVGLVTGLFVSVSTGLILLVYCITTLAYSFGLKAVPIVELAIVASGFVLRAAVGGAATDLPLTNWFLLVALFGSLFIVAGKRYAEVAELGSAAVATRSSNEYYTKESLNQVLTIACTATLVTYCIYAFDRAEISPRGNIYELTIAPFCIAILRYLSVLHKGGGGEPESVFISDRWLQILGVAWAALFVIAAQG